MLKVFRDNLKYLSWVLWLVILVFVVFLFTDFGAINPAGGGGGEADVAARVGKQRISYGDFEQAYRQQEAQLESVYGERIDPEMARQLGLYQQVMEFLVTERILLAEADRLGVEVSDAEVRDAILEYPVFLDEQGKFVGQERYQSILRNNRWSPADFEESVRRDMLTNRVRAILNQNVYVSEQEVEEAYREQAEKAKIRFVQLSSSEFASEVTLDEGELEAYFEEHRDDFEIPEKRVADYLLIDRAQLQASLEITDAEIVAYYQANQEDYTREEQVQARHILVRTGERSLDEAEARIAEARARIERGEDFAAVAAEISDDPGSKDRGGDLGSFGRGQMVGPFEEAAFGAEAGELVGPVETNFGLHLIEVLAKTEGGVQPLEQVSAGIRNRIAADRALTLAETKAVEISQRIEREDISDPEALRALADSELGVIFMTTEPFAEDGAVTGIGRSTAFTAAAFDAEVGDISEPIQVQRGWTLLRLSEIQESRIPELAEVESAVRAALTVEKQAELAEARLAASREELAGGKTLDEVAADLGLEVEESDEFTVEGAIGSLGRNRAVAEAALTLDAGDVGGPIRDDRGVVLFEVAERQRFDPQAFESEREATRTSLETQRATEVLTALISARRDELGVSYDPAFVENFQLGS